MANKVLNQLDTSQVASGFNDFLGSQGLGSMDPSSARRYKQGVEVSPMDELLALNGFDMESLFKRPLPEPPPLEAIDEIVQGEGSGTPGDRASSVRDAVASLGLNDDELRSLGNLVKSGTTTSTVELPGPILQLLQNPGINNAEDLLVQIGRFNSLIGGEKLQEGQDLIQTIQQWMRMLGTDNSSTLLNYLENKPTLTKELLRDPLTGISKPLGRTSSLLQITNAFTEQSISGSAYDETLLGSRAGGTRLTGGGGKDLFVITLSTKPFPLPTVISDFDSLTGSKLVIDTTNLKPITSLTFKFAKTRKSEKSLGKSNTSLIMSKKSGVLYFNDNGIKRGYGTGSGGAIAQLEGKTTLQAADILLFNSDGLLTIDGSPFL